MKSIFLCALLLALPVRADEDWDALRATSCRLAYDYDARDGALTCSGGYHRTFYAHWSARRARRLPAGTRLVIEYLRAPECGNGCWTRILRIEREW